MRVILTRPAEQSQAWREGIQAGGHMLLEWPLIETRSASNSKAIDEAWRERSRFRAIMFVSAAAVSYFFARHTGEDVAGIRCWATGPGTRRALRQAGVADAWIDSPAQTAAQFDTEHLWAVVADRVTSWPPGQTVAIVRGTDIGACANESDADSDAARGSQAGVGRDWLADQLRDAGAQVRWVVAYCRAIPHWDEAQCSRARTAASDGSVWVFSSSQAIRHLTTLLPGQSWARARAVATHPRIAALLTAMGWGQVLTSRPDVAGLLLKLSSLESDA